MRWVTSACAVFKQPGLKCVECYVLNLDDGEMATVSRILSMLHFNHLKDSCNRDACYVETGASKKIFALILQLNECLFGFR